MIIGANSNEAAGLGGFNQSIGPSKAQVDGAFQRLNCGGLKAAAYVLIGIRTEESS